VGHKPKKPCSAAGCPALVPSGTAYCEKHKGVYAQSRGVYDRGRGSSTKRGYDARWQKVRKAYLSVYPNCSRCGRRAEMVDHIQPIREGGSHYEWDNLQPMCCVCHRVKTEEDRRRSGRESEGQG